MMTNQERIAAFQDRLQKQLQPTQLVIDDESHLHAGHAGAAGGAGHFRITITTQAFTGLNSVARHRLVYGALKEFMPHEIHALAIHALAPNES
ncbi:BolA family protein [Polynucleobacter acidiphobus]|uniref:BolA family protein n=1 Tax=Polynucleobacter acidiphobus TaxID=556053 RepID=UPI000D3A01BC|nr:BolA family protein [Polynucleobacter acidiphobus]